MIVLWRKLFIQKCFSKYRMVMRNTKKNLRKESWERTSGTTKWDKLGQVRVRGKSGTRRMGSSDLSGTSGTRRRGSSDLSGTSGTRSWGSSDLRGTSGTRTRGLSTCPIPLVPNRTTRSWNFAQKRVKPWYLTLFRATKNSVVICRASLLYEMSYSFRSTVFVPMEF